MISLSKATTQGGSLVQEITNNENSHIVESKKRINNIRKNLDILDQTIITDANKLKAVVDNTMSVVHHLIERGQYELADIFHTRISDRLESYHSIPDTGNIVHKVVAKDSSGRLAYYFLVVEPEREQDFLQAIKTGKDIDLEKYGKIIASSYEKEEAESVEGLLSKQSKFDD